MLPIVVEDSARCREAAMFLSRVLSGMTGRVPEVFVEREGQDCDLPAGLFIGDVRANRGWTCPLAAESPEAFRVVAGDRRIRFLGRADHGVYDWCERELGLRCYGQVGLSLEPRAQVVARALDYSDRPVFAHRELDGGDVGLWLRCAKAGVSHPGGVNVHQPHGWFTNAALRAAHPCLFESGETPMLCYGNPETLAYYERRIERHLAGLEDSGGIVDTRRRVVTVSPWDAPIKCTCAHCRELYDASAGPAGVASPIVWGRFLLPLARWLGEKHPDYRISFLPYLNFRRVPREGLPGLAELGNAEAEPCTMPGLALLKNPQCRRAEEGLLRDWQEATGGKVLSWDYACWPRDWTSAPYVFGRTIRRHYEDLRDVLHGAFVCGGVSDARLQLSLYVWMRCLWNPDLDVGAVYDEFARRLFGPAAEPMRELIDLQETGWNRPWPDDRCTYANVFGISYPRADVLRMKALLREAVARTAAADDAQAFGLVLWYASGFEAFFAESDELASRNWCRTIEPGRTYAMVNAREALFPEPWAKTTVTTSVAGGTLRFRVRCEEPAVARMDFTRTVDDHVRGNDSVTFVLADGASVRTVTVSLSGTVSGGGSDFGATVSSDATGWTVEACVRLSDAACAGGELLGNVCRWRVGDRRLPEAERVSGSRFEHSRLNTCYTQPNDDPAAFVRFLLTADGAEGE